MTNRAVTDSTGNALNISVFMGNGRRRCCVGSMFLSFLTEKSAEFEPRYLKLLNAESNSLCSLAFMWLNAVCRGFRNVWINGKPLPDDVMSYWARVVRKAHGGRSEWLPVHCSCRTYVAEPAYLICLFLIINIGQYHLSMPFGLYPIFEGRGTRILLTSNPVDLRGKGRGKGRGRGRGRENQPTGITSAPRTPHRETKWHNS